MILWAVTLVLGMVGSASAVPIFTDDFNRANSNIVGNGWLEIEHNRNDVAIRNGSLRLRDYLPGNPDSAVLQGISLAGFENVWLDFDWAASRNTEASDKLYVSWDLDDNNWQTAWSQSLGGSNFASVNLDFLSAVDNQKDFRLAFWTDVSCSREAAFIDNIVLRGDVMGGVPTPTPSPVPEPSTLLLIGSGLLGLVGFNRKRFSK